MAVDRKTTISRFQRRATELLWPFRAIQKTNDPHKAIENLERASAAATLWILLGILLDIGALLFFAHATSERAVGIIANAAIGFGLIAEYLLVGKVIDATAAADRESNERIAKIEERAAAANERAAEASARAAESERQLEELRKATRARRINGNEFVTLLKGAPSLPVEIMFAKDDGEAFHLALDIRNFVRIAGWTAVEPVPIPSTNQPVPTTMSVGGQPSGVSLVAHSMTRAEFDALGPEFNAPNPAAIVTPFLVLYRALISSLGQLSASAGGPAIPPPGTLRIVVGSRPAPLN